MNINNNLNYLPDNSLNVIFANLDEADKKNFSSVNKRLEGVARPYFSSPAYQQRSNAQIFSENLNALADQNQKKPFTTQRLTFKPSTKTLDLNQSTILNLTKGRFLSIGSSSLRYLEININPSALSMTEKFLQPHPKSLYGTSRMDPIEEITSIPTSSYRWLNPDYILIQHSENAIQILDDNGLSIYYGYADHTFAIGDMLFVKRKDKLSRISLSELKKGEKLENSIHTFAWKLDLSLSFEHLFMATTKESKLIIYDCREDRVLAEKDIPDSKASFQFLNDQLVVINEKLYDINLKPHTHDLVGDHPFNFHINENFLGYQAMLEGKPSFIIYDFQLRTLVTHTIAKEFDTIVFQNDSFINFSSTSIHDVHVYPAHGPVTKCILIHNLSQKTRFVKIYHDHLFFTTFDNKRAHLAAINLKSSELSFKQKIKVSASTDPKARTVPTVFIANGSIFMARLSGKKIKLEVANLTQKIDSLENNTNVLKKSKS